MGGIEVVGRDGDVDVDRQQRRTSETVRRIPQARADDRHRGPDATLRQTQQRELGARSAAELLGALERLLGPVELAEAAPDVADLGVGGRAVADVAADQLVARLQRLAFGLGEIAAPLEHHGAVHAADPGEDREGMLLRPAQRRLGPLGGAVEVADLLARADQAAVHLAGRVRPEAALDREEHRLVEMAHPLRDLALVDQDPAVGLQRLGLEVGRPEAPAERDHSCREGDRGGRGRRCRARSRPRGAARPRARRTRCRRRGSGGPAGATPALPRDAALIAWCSHSHTAHCPARR